MKKRIALLLCFALLLPVLSLASCAGDGGDETAAVTTENGGPYTVTFVAGGRETTVTVERGETPVCPEEFLSWETDEHYCKVTGWDREIVPAQGDATYTATVGEYGLTLYDVLFVLPIGIVKVPTHEGEIPTPPKGYETDDTQKYKIGSFKQWNTELTAPTADNTENGTKKMSYSPIYTYEPRYVAALTPVKDGAKGIFTMTYDDGRYYTAMWVNEENKKYGLTGSCMMVPNWNKSNPDFTFDGGSIAKWNALFADGTLEPQSHSMSHEGKARLADESSSIWEECKYNNYQENYRYELVQAVTELKKAFPNFDPICFAPSNNTLSRVSWRSDGKGNLLKDTSGNYVLVKDGGATKVAEATYYAIRKGDRHTVQTLDPAPDGNAGGWYNLAIKAFKDFSGDEKLTQGKKWLDDAVNNGTWLIVMCHGITTNGGDIKQSLADQFFAYAGQYVKNGVLWSATFGDATKYIRERQGTTVSARFENDAVLVDMTIDRTTADGKTLDESVFNYPLTVEVRVPDAWKNVQYTDGGKTLTAEVYKHDGASFAMVNLTPGANGATVTTAVTRASAN